MGTSLLEGSQWASMRDTGLGQFLTRLVIISHMIVSRLDKPSLYNRSISNPLLTRLWRKCTPPHTPRVFFAHRQTCDAQVIRDIRNDEHNKACIRHERDSQYYEHEFLCVLWSVLD